MLLTFLNKKQPSALDLKKGEGRRCVGEIVLIKILPFIPVITFKQATAASPLVTVPKKK